MLLLMQNIAAILQPKQAFYLPLVTLMSIQGIYILHIIIYICIRTNDSKVRMSRHVGPNQPRQKSRIWSESAVAEWAKVWMSSLYLLYSYVSSSSQSFYIVLKELTVKKTSKHMTHQFYTTHTFPAVHATLYTIKPWSLIIPSYTHANTGEHP